MKAVSKAGRIWQDVPQPDGGHGVKLNEWEKPGWTYHAKGALSFKTNNSLLVDLTLVFTSQVYGFRRTLRTFLS